MTLIFNILFQVAAVLVQGANMLTSLTPPKYQGVVFLLVGIAQVLVAYRAHYFNPDGTPSTVAYVKPPKK